MLKELKIEFFLPIPGNNSEMFLYDRVFVVCISSVLVHNYYFYTM